jgi:hypothetical protein
MNERGWGWTASEIRRVQLLEWIAAESAKHPVQASKVKSFYDARLDQSENDIGVASGDLDSIVEAGLVKDDFGAGIGGIEIMGAWLEPQGSDRLERLHAQRAHKGQRRAACRDAMVAWLYSVDATIPERTVLRERMHQDLAHGMWQAMPFTPIDVDEAAGWLRDQGLVDGVASWQNTGPVRLYLTSSGIACAERFDADTRRYEEAQMGRSSGPTVSITHNSGPLQVAGDHAHQVQHLGASAEHIRELITSLTELVRLAVPTAMDIDSQQTVALKAAQDGAVDRPALKRFADWALAIVGKGASAALTPLVTAATTDMLHEAGRLTGHL